MSTWEEYLLQQQNVDGVQMTWNIWPYSRVDAQKLVVPVATFFTPLKERPADQPQQPPLEYDPVLCQKSTCKAVLNPLCMVDFRTKIWQCPFCQQRNPFPPHYAAIAEDNRPPELYPQFTTIEYTLKKATTLPPIFLFVVDTCISGDELKALKESLTTALSLLPADAFVGLITFGRMVEVHELNVKGIARSYVFKGAKEVTQKQIHDIIALHIGRPIGSGGAAAGAPAHGGAPSHGMPQPQGGPIPTQQFPGAPGPRPMMPMGPGAPGPMGPAGVGPVLGGKIAPGMPQVAPLAPQIPFNKFLQPVSECEASINDLIEQIQTDRWPVPQGQRPLRATGAALAVAVTLLEVAFPNTGARIMTFIGGACTIGPGMVVGEELKNPIRSWHDIKEDNAPFMRKANKFYDGLAHVQ